MRKRIHSQSGISIITVIIAAAMVGVSLLPLSSSLKNKQNLTRSNSQKIVAEAMASELAELFRAHTETSFTNLLRKTATRGSYFYCAHINLLDRDHNKTLNPDSLADLPANSLIANASRYYQVSIVNIKTPLVPKTDICGQSFSTVVPGPDERYLVSVGVSWPDTVVTDNLNTVSIATLIPDKLNHAL